MPHKFEDLEAAFGVDEDAPSKASANGHRSEPLNPDAYMAKLLTFGRRWKDMLATPGAHSYSSASECDMAVVGRMVVCNFTDAEIWATLERCTRYQDRVERKGETHSRELYEQEIAKARATVTPFAEKANSYRGGRARVERDGFLRSRGDVPDEDDDYDDDALHADDDGRRSADVRLGRFPRTDAGNAEIFAALYGDRLRYDHRRGEWLIYGPHWWHPDVDGEVLRLAKEAARKRYLAAMNIADEHDRTAEAKFAIGSENRARIDATLALARAEHPIADSGDGWDADAYLLGVANGVLDLRTGSIRTGMPEDRLSRHAPVAFDPAARAPRFEHFLEEILPVPHVREYVKRLAGIALTADVKEQVLPFWYGGGANGKSTLATVIREILGRAYARQAAPGLLLRTNSDRHPTELADLFGSRLVISVEVDDGRALAESLVKWLTGGDQIKARFMKQDFFEFAPTFKIWLLANHRPAIRGTDRAIWRRVKLIPFTVTIAEEQWDTHLGEKLWAERAGILNWMIDGCLAWQREGLQEPAEVRAAVEEYRQDADVLAPFIEACCALLPSVSTPAEHLYKAYRSWAQDAGQTEKETLGSRRFGERISERFQRKTVEGRRRYLGVALRSRGGE